MDVVMNDSIEKWEKKAHNDPNAHKSNFLES